MLIGGPRRKADLRAVRRIKRALREVLDLPEEATVTVAELTCLDAGCAPIETVIGLLRPNAPQLQHKLHKAADDVVADDLARTCKAWGLDRPTDPFLPFFLET